MKYNNEDIQKAIKNQKRIYNTQIEYKGEVGKCEAQFKVAAEQFNDNPNPSHWRTLQDCMARLQNIKKNCRYQDPFEKRVIE